MVDDVLLAGLAAGLAILAFAVFYVGVFAIKVNRQAENHQATDPDVDLPAELNDATGTHGRKTHERVAHPGRS